MSATAGTLTRRTVRLAVGCNVTCAVTVRARLAAASGPAAPLMGPPRAALMLVAARPRTVTFTITPAEARVLATRLRKHHRRGLILTLSVRATRSGAAAAVLNRTVRLAE